MESKTARRGTSAILYDGAPELMAAEEWPLPHTCIPHAWSCLWYSLSPLPDSEELNTKNWNGAIPIGHEDFYSVQASGVLRYECDGQWDFPTERYVWMAHRGHSTHFQQPGSSVP
jgi:hypothetical protein